MRTILFQVALCAMLAAIIGDPARAGIILDYSPGATGAELLPHLDGQHSWWNESDDQNFAEIVNFATGASITGMDVYTIHSDDSDPAVGGDVVVRLWSDASGQPGVLISETTETIAVIDDEGAGALDGVIRVHVDLAAALSLDAGVSYWIGMSGSDDNIGQFTLDGPNAPGDASSALFVGRELITTAASGDMAFRLEGTPGSAVPEPSSWLMGAAAAGFGLALARRRRAA